MTTRKLKSFLSLIAATTAVICVLDSLTSDNTYYLRSIFDEIENEDRRSLANELNELNKNLQDDSGAASNLEKFIIITQQRSGSGLLTQLLDHHSTIRCGGELMTQENATTMTVDEYVELMNLNLQHLPQEETPSSPIGAPLTHVGFKIMYNRGILDLGTDLIQRLKQDDVKLIHLVRSNKLLHYISSQSNKQDHSDPVGEEHIAHPETQEGANGLNSIIVEGGPDEVLEFIKTKAEQNEQVTRYLNEVYGDGNYLTIYYEDLDVDNQREVDRVFKLLGVESENVTTSFRKIHEGKNAREYFHETERKGIEMAIKESEFAFMLDPDLPGYLGW